jgi:SAM-dependent methyltransferase
MQRPSPVRPHHAANIERFSGFAERYDEYRPRPPVTIADLLTRMAQAERPRLVVDIGCGTGLSTRLWAGRADCVVGIEPSPDTRAYAEQCAVSDGQTANIRFQDGTSTATGLPNGSADIVTCSQALHWMEPEATFVEVHRIVRAGGVFATYDWDWPPTVHWELEAAYHALMEKVTAMEMERGVYRRVKKWDKTEHLSRMQASGRFRFVREVVVHHTEDGNADRFVGLVRTQGGVATLLLKEELTEREIGLDTLRDVARRTVGNTAVPWHFSYRVRVGIR